MSDNSVTQFMRLFSGSTTAHGVFEITGKEEDKITGKAYTLKEAPTLEKYAAHVKGTKGIGIVPIDSDSKCAFCAIDIDVYSGIDGLRNVIREYLPMVNMFRSKSGGLHLYTFFEEPVSVKKLRPMLNDIRAILGLNSKTEIFPKQTVVAEDKIGNWINLPYFNAEKTERYLYGADDKPMAFEDAMEALMRNRWTLKRMDEYLSGLPVSDGPPCIQHLYIAKATSHRNLYLFSYARYCKAKFGDDFEMHVMRANDALDKPLTLSELTTTVINSHKKKEYSYKCSEEPICSVCDKAICKTRKFGVGSLEISDITFEEFTQYKADPPYYEWKINGVSMKFYTEADVINQTSFRELCFRLLHILPNKLKDPTWTRIINTALSNIVIKEINPEEDISPGALFADYLAEFLTGRAMAANREQILLDRVYLDTERKVYVFRAKNLITFLINTKQFRMFGQTQIQDRLKMLGGVSSRYYINQDNSNIRVWTIPIEAIDSFKEPSIKDTAIDFQEAHDAEQF